MYVLIDMEDMVIRHKFPDHPTLSSLAKIELSHVRAKVIPVSLAGVGELTDMELRLLHSHVSKTTITKAVFHRLVNEVLELLKGLPDSNVNPFEVKHQAAQIGLRDSGFYRYVKGAYKAALVTELFTPPAIDVTTPAHVAQVVPVAAVVVVVPQQPVKTVQQPLQTPAVVPSWHPAYKPA